MFGAMGKQHYTQALERLIAYAEEVELSVDELRRDWVMIDTFRHHLAAFFRNYDALITPVYTDIAFEHGASMDAPEQYAFVFPFSLSGSPVVVVPAGHDRVTGMPIGIQIVGPHWHENQLFDLARFIERTMGGWRKAPLL
ncbi:Glutamyl-tRNA(Gln) amidotransferase subunit A [compost metagenome]